MKKVFVLGMLFLAFSCATATKSGSSDVSDTVSANKAVGSDTGNELLDMEFQDMEGNVVTVSSLKVDRPVVLAFWATWCEPCKVELAALKELSESYGDKVLFVAISTDTEESIETAKQWIMENDIKFPALFDPNGEVITKIPGGSVPFSMVLNKKGKVVYTHSGYEPGDEKELKKLLDSLLKE